MGRHAAWPLLEEAGLAEGVIEVLFTGLDRGVEGGEAQDYERALPIAEAEHALLAWEMNGAPLPPQHGFPLRLVVPGWYGMQNVKWLARITLLEEPFTGYQNAVGYRLYDAEGLAGEPVTRMLPRSLTVPPGAGLHDPRAPPVARPGDARGSRLVRPRPDRRGRGLDRRRRPVRARGPGRAARRAAWRGWRFAWDAPPGEHVISSRATDSAGNTQPIDPHWNLKGYANNAVERVPVLVEKPGLLVQAAVRSRSRLRGQRDVLGQGSTASAIVRRSGSRRAFASRLVANSPSSYPSAAPTTTSMGKWAPKRTRVTAITPT